MSVGKYYYGARFVTNYGTDTEYVMGDGTLSDGTGLNTTIGTDADLTTSGATVVDDIVLTDGVVISHSTRTLTLNQLGYTGATNANNYVHPTYNTTNINTANAVIIDSISTNSTGHITAMGTRTLTLANLGYTGANDANKYVHPTYAGDDISVDTGALSGAVVISDLDFNVTTDTQGHVTDANATFATRTLTLGNLGYTGATDANKYVHPGYSATNINTSGAVIVDSITTNSTGHITAMGTRTLTLTDLGYTADGEGVATINPSTVDGKEGIEVLNGSTATATIGLDLDLIDLELGLAMSEIVGIDSNGKNVKSPPSTVMGFQQYIHQITGNGSATSFACGHDLGSQLHVQIWDLNSSSSSYRELVYPKVEYTSGSNLQVTFNTAPISGQNYMVLMMKINGRVS